MYLTVLELKRLLEFAEEHDLPSVNVIQKPEFHRVIAVEAVWGNQKRTISDDRGAYIDKLRYNNGFYSGNSIKRYYICSRTKERQYRIKCKIQGIGIINKLEEEDVDYEY